MTLRPWFAVAAVAGVIAVAACTPVSKWESWRTSNVRYEVRETCFDGAVGHYDPINDVVCIDQGHVNRTIDLSLKAGKPKVAYLAHAWILHHEAAHEMDFLLGQGVATALCAKQPTTCPQATRSLGWERGAECIMQLVRPDLDVVRQQWFAGDGRWTCPPEWRAFYLPRLRYAGVL
jgi:hypothetical protein